MKIKGNPKYLYALLDDETRYWIAKEVAGDKFSREAPEYASRLFRQGKEVVGKKPLTLITDGLHAYHLAYKREFYAHQKPVTKHVEHVTWQRDKGNEKMEAFNGNTVRSREKVMRSLKREDLPILDGHQIFHNYVRLVWHLAEKRHQAVWNQARREEQVADPNPKRRHQTARNGHTNPVNQTGR